jgi:hypothetical protein
MKSHPSPGSRNLQWGPQKTGGLCQEVWGVILELKEREDPKRLGEGP